MKLGSGRAFVPTSSTGLAPTKSRTRGRNEPVTSTMSTRSTVSTLQPVHEEYSMTTTASRLSCVRSTTAHLAVTQMKQFIAQLLRRDHPSHASQLTQTPFNNGWQDLPLRK